MIRFHSDDWIGVYCEKLDNIHKAEGRIHPMWLDIDGEAHAVCAVYRPNERQNLRNFITYCLKNYHQVKVIRNLVSIYKSGYILPGCGRN